MRKATVTLSCLILPLSGLKGQSTTEPPSLTEMRKKLEAAAGAETALLNDLYQRALSGVQANAAQQGDYEQALAARRRREQLAAQSATLRAQSGADAGTELLLKDARLAGGLTLSPLSISNWRSAQASADWTLNRIPPGRYEVHLTYRWQPATGAAIPEPPQWLFREVSSLAGAAANQVKCTLSPTTVSSPGNAKADGTLSITTLPFTLRVTPVHDYEGQDLALTGVRLVPVNTAATAPVDLTFTSHRAELDTLLEAHRAEIRSIRQPLVEDYIKNLGTLTATGAAGRKVVDAEMRRAQAALDADSAGTSTLLAASGKAGLTTLTGAKYVEDPGNTGTRFKVEHEGQTFIVTMMWVASPPPEPSLDVKAYRLARERFQVDELHAVALGQAAKEFTALYLTDRPIKLLARAIPESDGSLSALVYVEPVGLFQNVLIDHGLAVVDSAAGGRRMALEAGILTSLHERESRARSSTPAEGGWAK